MNSNKEEQRSRPKVGVGCMILRENKVLLGRRRRSFAPATYGWVGGHLEFGETLEECAERKAYEESGLIVRSLKLLCVSNVREYDNHYLDIEFLAEKAEGDPQLLKPTIDSWGWFNLDDLPTPLFRPVELAIQSYLTGRKYNP